MYQPLNEVKRRETMNIPYKPSFYIWCCTCRVSDNGWQTCLLCYEERLYGSDIATDIEWVDAWCR